MRRPATAAMDESTANELRLGGSGEYSLHVMAERLCDGLSYRQLRVFRDAVDSHEHARRAREYDAMLGMAREYLWRGQPEAALSEIARALSLDLGREEAFVLLGQVLERQGRLDTARAAYFGVLQLAPYCDEARRGLARVEERLQSPAGTPGADMAPAPAAEYRIENNRR